MNEQRNDNQNEQNIQLNDLPVTDEQAEQAKGGISFPSLPIIGVVSAPHAKK